MNARREICEFLTFVVFFHLRIFGGFFVVLGVRISPNVSKVAQTLGELCRFLNCLLFAAYLIEQYFIWHDDITNLNFWFKLPASLLANFINHSANLCSLSSWAGSNRDTDRMLPDETLPVHRCRCHCVAEDCTAGIGDRSTAELSWRVGKLLES